ncbi:membrane protein [Mycolicibacterium madagascariense]|uniref:Membrane protein n=1 Tax=Mycolicibacterium madagascariense TaxID=212765 RepID=A0A7I7XKC5_9MYCO|nr:MMPL family transporter [Mycolicibacterium madagascariense]MCV7011230.1 MMPL family transporter [Mycolicibacterium madagascariense]BBZ29582.1 membrane protein [Mycolicibacterium madagascariense]
MTSPHQGHSGIARLIRTLALPIVLGWLALTVLTNVLVPSLEVVGQQHTVSMNAKDAPSMMSMEKIGRTFDEFTSDSNAMIILEGDRPLGADAHRYYDQIVKKLEADTAHVEHIQDFWGDPLTAAGAQSNDGRSAYVQVYLHGNMGETLANESAEAVRKIVDGTPAPPGVKAYVTGGAPLVADQHDAGDKSILIVTIITLVVIAVMLILVYRSVVTMIMILLMVFSELGAARGIVAFLGYHEVIGLSTFATSLLTLLVIAAGTDYAIFLIGRFQEARGAGEDKEQSYYSMFHGTAHVVLGSGLTIAGAMLCLSFTRLPYFQTLGVPCAVGTLVAVIAALTLGPSVVVLGSRIGLFEPKRAIRSRGWRRLGTLIVRWPAPILVATIALALVGLLALPSYHPNYNDRKYLPADMPANVGYQVADKHFNAARMNPELLMIESDHDLRTSADFLVIDKIAKAIFHTPGISRVQTITRPDGKPIKHSTIPFMLSMQGTSSQMNQKYQQDSFANLLKQADDMQTMINTLTHMLSLIEELSANVSDMSVKIHELAQTVYDVRNSLADFEDPFRPLRAYLYWEPHCYDIPLCQTGRAVFDALDGVDLLSDQIGGLVDDTGKLAALTPQLADTLRPQVQQLKDVRMMLLTTYQVQKGQLDQQTAMSQNSSAMGDAFDTAMNDDTFYLPPEIFQNADFKRGMKNFISPDGHSVRFIISHEGDPASAEGISHIDAIKQAAKEAIKGTPLEGSSIYLAGTAATYKDMRDGSYYDLLIAGISAVTLIFIIMLIITRAVVAAAVIVGTVLLSLGASFGLSVLLWQHIIGLDLHWMVLAMSIILLLAVGSDYNLLLVSRFKEELHGGLKTGIIRSMAGTGSVVTSAGLVFAATMATFATSDLIVMGQVGTTIALGLLFDTLIVRTFMTPAIAALMGKWFWWPTIVRSRAASRLPGTAAGTEPVVVGP